MKILMIRFESFPYGSAPSFRAYVLSKLIIEEGHDITVLAPHINFNRDEISEDGYCYCQPHLRAIGAENYDGKLDVAVEQLLEDNSYDLVIRPTSIKYYLRILKIINSYNLPLVMDSVEWFDPSNWHFGRLDPRYYWFQFLWKCIFHRCEGIIAISRLIESYYIKKKVKNVVRIPTITDCYSMNRRIEVKSEKIHFVFAGQMDKGKDSLLNFIIAMSKLTQGKDRLFLDIYGPKKEDVFEQMGNYKYLLNDSSLNIAIHGRVPQKEVQNICLNSDFSVFFRQNRRSANAGFPTKLGECMTMGTPAICNNTGDISLVVRNGENGFLLESDSIDEIKKMLQRLLTLSLDERIAMRKAARETAEEFFDYRNYKKDIRTVLENAVSRR